jgi:protein-S-isoprenylcysteine O-methyltransferase Ste14
MSGVSIGGEKLSASAELVGLILFALTQALGTWAVRANFYYFCAPALMQKQRGYRVIMDGPYRYIRHPGYLAVLLGMLTAAVGIGSWIALIPAVLFSSVLIWRTVLEDRFLREHVPTYEDYAVSVRYRLFPWVW